MTIEQNQLRILNSESEFRFYSFEFWASGTSGLVNVPVMYGKSCIRISRDIKRPDMKIMVSGDNSRITYGI